MFATTPVGEYNKNINVVEVKDMALRFEHYDHPTHILPARDNPPENLEMWCGGTIPPTLIEVNYETRVLTIAVHDEDTDVHAYSVTDEPLHVEVRQESMAGDFDAYTISRGAVKTVRMLKGLNPDDKASKDYLQVSEPAAAPAE